MTTKTKKSPFQFWLDAQRKEKQLQGQQQQIEAQLPDHRIVQRDVAPATVDVELQVLRMADAGLPVPKPFTAAQIDAAEKKLGRKLSADEKEFGVIARPASSLPAFKPILAADSDDPWAAEIADAERELESEKVGRMSPAEARLYFAQKAKTQAAAQQASEDARREHLAANSSQLKRLHALRIDAMTNPEFSSDDLATIESAIRQIETLGNDPEVAAALVGQVADIQSRHLQERKDAVAAKLKDAGLDQSEISAALAKRFPEQQSPANPPEETQDDKPSDSPYDVMLAKLNDLRAGMKAQYSAKAKEVTGEKDGNADGQ